MWEGRATQEQLPENAHAPGDDSMDGGGRTVPGATVEEGAGGVGFGDHGKVVADGRAQGTLMKLILVIPNRR